MSVLILLCLFPVIIAISKACEFQNDVIKISCAQGNKSMWKGLNTSLFFIYLCVLSVIDVMLFFVRIY